VSSALHVIAAIAALAAPGASEASSDVHGAPCPPASDWPESASHAPSIGSVPARPHVVPFSVRPPTQVIGASFRGPLANHSGSNSGRAQTASDPWTSEDKFRHVAASWAVTVFAYAAARSIDVDAGTALAIALPVAGAAGVAKEIADHRAGGPFSFRDLAADALGAGVAWLFLREVR
jgi:uncharacterized protein YfiM (DUF2279 family)